MHPQARVAPYPLTARMDTWTYPPREATRSACCSMPAVAGAATGANLRPGYAPGRGTVEPAGSSHSIRGGACARRVRDAPGPRERRQVETQVLSCGDPDVRWVAS